MPRLASLRLDALTELADQLRFAPRAATARQVLRAEDLVGELDPDATYPEDWLIFRLTGYRPDIEAPRLIVGSAILGELSAFVERLCDQAALGQNDLQGDCLSASELAERWGVSRRTLERYRRQGLVARRLRTPRGGTSIVFARTIIDRFALDHADRLEGAARFTHLSEEERRRANELAETLRAADDTPSHAGLVNAVAQRLGRSPGAVRAALAHGRDETPTPLSARDRRVIHRALRLGVPTTRLAQRFDRSRASIGRIARQRQAELLRRADLGAHRVEDAASGWRETPGAADGLRVVPEPHARRFLDEALAASPLPAAREAVLANTAVRLVSVAKRALATPATAGPAAHQLDAIETDLRWVLAIRRALVHAERGLIARTIAERIGPGAAEHDPRLFERAHALAFAAALAAVARFDPATGGRLAAPIGIAIGRTLAPLQALAGPPRARPASERDLWDWTGAVAPWAPLVEAPHWLEPILPRLRPDDRAILIARYGLGGHRPLTLVELAALGDAGEGGGSPGRLAAAGRRARAARHDLA